MLRHIDIGNAGTELPRWARTRGHGLQLHRIRTVDCGSQGMVIKFGRHISPPDIEAQLAPDNYLHTHSLMFTFDCYTQTGINTAIKLNDQWSIYAFSARPWGNGRRKGQLMLAMDALLRF